MMQMTTMNEFKKAVSEVIDEHPIVMKLQSDTATLKSDVSILKEDVKVLKDDVKVLKDDVKVLKEDVNGLKVEQHRQGIILEHLNDKFDSLYEAIMIQKDTTDQVKVHEYTLEDHSVDIATTKKALQHHINNKKIHLDSKNRAD